MNKPARAIGLGSLLVVAVMLVSTAAYGQMSVAYGSSTIHNHTDSNGTTTVTLNPDPLYPDVAHSSDIFLETAPSQAFQDAMTKSKAAADWANLSFDYTGNLSGQLTIDVYNAKLKDATNGGAQFLAHYNRAATDPAANDLFWIQVVDSTLKNGGETIPYPDVYFSSYPAGSKLPFYFRPDETTLDANPYVGAANIRSSNYTVNGTKYDYDLAFWDWPSRPATNSWSAELFLATYDSANKKVTVYDGVKWGFDVTTVPEMSEYALWCLLLALAGLVVRRQRAAA